MTSQTNIPDENEEKVMWEIFERVIFETYGKSLAELRQLAAQGQKIVSDDMLDTLILIFDPENYPPESIVIFEGDPHVPMRLYLEKMQRDRNTKF